MPEDTIPVADINPSAILEQDEGTGTDNLADALGPVDSPLLGGTARRFPVDERIDLPGLVRDLGKELDGYAAQSDEDPFSNPILRLALSISRRLHRGELRYGAIEQLIQYLTADGFVHRAEALSRYLGEIDVKANLARLKERIRGLALPPDRPPEDGPIPFDAFRTRIEREIFGVVITAHPTFSMSGDLMEMLANLATGCDAQGQALPRKKRQDLVRRMAALEHRPDPELTLSREHELSMAAIGNIQIAMRQLYGLVFEVARDVYPDRWTELTPRLITVASWVGYDLDGRSDIRWSDTLQKRLRVQGSQLRHYLAEVRSIGEIAPGIEDLRNTLELLESRLALAINEVTDEIAVFSGQDPQDASGYQHIQRIALRMHDGIGLRLNDTAHAIELIGRAIRLADDEAVVRRLCVLRAELANYGLGMAHTHVRINATQLHNAIRKTVGMETAPDDPRYRQSYLASINDLLDKVQPVTINFGSIIAERTSAKRLFMVVAQMLKYADATTPIRFLIAESESAFTVLSALYYARLFGIADKVDISPLFETEKALELGSRVIDQLLDNPHYRAYVQERGRLCIQTGFSDAGRYLGQTPASASIERLRLRIARLFPKHGLTDVQLVIFDTHGESIGRGAHPRSFEDRLSYIATPTSLAFLDDNRIDFKQEMSFQGGDGYLYFVTPAGALAVITRILDHLLAPKDGKARDPFYDEADYITEFFTTVKEFQVSLMRDPNYGALLSAFGTNLLYPSGSRAIKRQHDAPADESEQTMANQFRAIPHNAILLQLGLPANVIGGVGEAIDKDPERFKALYAKSPRFRQLMGIIEYGAAVASPDALRAYVETLNPGMWLLRAAKQTDRMRAEEMRRLADYLEDIATHARQVRVFRKLHKDFFILEGDLAEEVRNGAGSLIDDEGRKALSLLHALRLAVIHEIFLLATHIPQFSSQHNTTHKRMIGRILHLDITTAVRQLEQIFPAMPPALQSADFGESATYVSDESQNYSLENQRIFKPMLGLYELMRRCSTGISHRIGFFG